MNYALCANGLYLRKGAKTILNDVSFRLEKGSFTAFIGKNGAGKSTTLKVCSGLVTPTSGSVSIFGVDVHENRRQALKSAGCIIETPEMYPDCTPRQILGYVGRLCGLQKREASEKTETLLDFVDMSEYIDVRIRHFSKGMKQRIGIAQALVHDPPLLMLDEPFSGLDPKGFADIRKMLVTLNKEGTTIFMSTHILSEAQSICDGIVVIDDGKIVSSGALGEFLATPDRSFILSIKYTGVITEALFSDIRGMDGVVSVEGNQGVLRVEFMGTDSKRSALLAMLLSRGINILEIKEKCRTLEETFFHLMR